MFNARLSAPLATDSNAANVAYGGNNHALIIDNATGCVLPNCTGYVHLRALELGGAGLESKLCLNNAVAYWTYNDGLPRGQEPRLGAIAVWSGGSKGYGHVAIVEEIYSNGDILTSNSNYSGTYFYTKRMSKPYAPWSGYKLLGFIYLVSEALEPLSNNDIRLKLGSASRGDIATLASRCESLGISYHVSGEYIVTDTAVSADKQVELLTLCNSLGVGCNAYYEPLSSEKVRLRIGELTETETADLGALLSSLGISYALSDGYIITDKAISAGDQVLIVAECDRLSVGVAIYNGEPVEPSEPKDILVMIDDLRAEAVRLTDVEEENKQLKSDLASAYLTIDNLRKIIDDINALAVYN